MIILANFIDRDISWLDFNDRVLAQFHRRDLPIEERIRFIGIAANNLSEFISVRFALMQNTKSAELSSVLKKIKEQKKAIEDAYKNTTLYYKYSSEVPEVFTEEYFMERVFPALTPISVDNTKEIPTFEENELCFFIQLRSEEESKFCFIQIPHQLSRVQEKKKESCLIENLIMKYIDKILGEEVVQGMILFSIHKNFDSELEIEEGKNALDIAKELVDRRKSNKIAFLNIYRKKPEGSIERLGMVKRLFKLLKVNKNNIYLTESTLMLEFLQDIDYTEGNYPDEWIKKWKPKYPEFLENNGSFFDAIDDGDIMLHYPYDKFAMADFLNEAASDGDVISIKQTLYRISGNKSPIVKALKKAAKNGKKVTVLIELFARFDERRNIKLIKSLKKAGCNIVYSPGGLKTHAKMCLVTKRKKDGIIVYSQFGTGNYNEKTSKIYTDISIFTKRKDIGYQLNSVFNMVSGFNKDVMKDMLVKYSPHTIRTEIEKLIKETAEKSNEHNAMIMFKMNSLSDPKMVEYIQNAAEKYPKCQFMILCRGICSLPSNLPNIHIKSIVGRFLEHSRIYATVVDENATIYISSADLMTRNLDYRVEIMVPISSSAIKKKIMEILSVYWKDNANSWILEDTTWKKAEIDEYMNAHNEFIKMN